MDNDHDDLEVRHHTIRGRELRDKNGQLIGVVEDVIFEEWSEEPRLLVVHPKGWMHDLLHDDRYVPVVHGYFEGDAIVTEYEHDEVLHAPVARWHQHIVDGETEHDIAEHYHLTEDLLADA